MIKAIPLKKVWNIKNIICATTSPRRIRLLKKSFPKIKFKAPSYKEKKRRYFISPVLLSIYYASKKTKEVKCDDNCILLSFDTIVYRNFKIYSKPHDKEDALRTIRELSSRIHKVVTGICIKKKNKTRFFYEVSKVKLKKLSDRDISDYISTGEWKDKAGGYGIQEKGRALVQWYRGDFYNIVGIPINRVMELLK